MAGSLTKICLRRCAGGRGYLDSPAAAPAHPNGDYECSARPDESAIALPELLHALQVEFQQSKGLRLRHREKTMLGGMLYDPAALNETIKPGRFVCALRSFTSAILRRGCEKQSLA